MSLAARTPPARRAIVTRPERDAAQWVVALHARGIEATALPLIAIAGCSHPDAVAALRRAREGFGDYRAVMFVSANAVRYFFESNRPPAHDPLGHTAIKTRAWSPGPGTAQALRDSGMPAARIDQPAATAGQFDSESLWERVQPQVQPGDRILIVRGAQGEADGPSDAAQGGTGREWLAQQIAAAGGQVEFVAAYERAAPQLTPAQQALATQAATDGSLWLFSSSEAIAHLAAALPGQDWREARALVTHPRIAQAADALGFGAVRQCRPALDDVVASIESHP
ncbi:uroporphyrinogen-III synthase [Acidovorax sp. SUPP950]|uniref:uroporphyrinogen-III synthase n=1 Tax=unclassified Acidovorax TaxID=2684926 RepID=UPI0023D727C7|nr:MULTISPECIES: uroporphyrinogen-III synthase [unclassified Acidovorax]GKS74205.1 uroporphyrinogen-III synthase [Acidovorax sp. SUPP950]GKS88562.1 uroporphyrinogen-III synthase [Acidovorax sp. SUPP2539]